MSVTEKKERWRRRLRIRHAVDQSEAAILRVLERRERKEKKDREEKERKD